MQAPRVLAADCTAMQALFACYGLATAYAVWTGQPTPAREVVLVSGLVGQVLLWMLAVCSALSLADVILNHELRLHRWFGWLNDWHYLSGLLMAIAWGGMAFIAAPRFDSHGLVAVYVITVFFQLAALVRDAARRRHGRGCGQDCNVAPR